MRNPQCMREKVTVVTLCVCVCHFFILEKAPFSEFKLTSLPLNVALLSYEKSEWNFGRNCH